MEIKSLGLIRKTTVALYIVLSLFTMNAWSNGTYSDFTISQLQYSRGANVLHVVFSGGNGNPNPDNCDRSDMFVAPYGSSTSIPEKYLISGITTVYATKRKSTVLLSGCLGGIGGKSYPAIWYFYAK